MRLFFRAVFGLAMLAASTGAASAQAGFAAGLVTGALFASGNSTADVNANVLYLAPRIAERVKDPLDVRVGYSSVMNEGNGLSVREYFQRGFRSPGAADRFEILQVVRLASGGSANAVYLWFLYIEKDKVIALDKLPVLAQK